ncbi:sugar phosphate isomerase/epimerase, partial [Ruminococcaceae bacterium OttesenSCG-928-L11]|nr:sugar phosphate isomerase/epimerase [Ruminococcaceae bacterium OttesenSCG-928-L11]
CCVMELGAYSPEIEAQSVGECFAKARQLGFTRMQYNFLTSHGEEMPERIGSDALTEIRAAADSTGIAIEAVNGTFNMADPDPVRRKVMTARFPAIVEACQYLGCGCITLCTGSRSPDSMWRFHPDNSSPAAWRDVLHTTEQLLPMVEGIGIVLGVETEATNVVSTVEKTRQYLDVFDSPHLRVIMDCANIFPLGTAHRESARPMIERAFALLGDDLVLAHGKDIREATAPDRNVFTCAGKGIVDFDCFLGLLQARGYTGGMILHGIHDPEEFRDAVTFMREKLAAYPGLSGEPHG